MIRLLALLLFIAFWLAAIAGWVLNVVATVHMIVAHAPVDALFVGRIVGIPVAVLGSVLGWL